MNNEIIEKLTRIETKLDEVIAALHAYDDENIQHCEYSGLPSVKMYDEKDIMIWDIDGAERRMDIIGQNSNEGSHYVTNEEADDDATFNDYGQRVVGDNNNNTQDKRTVGEKNKRTAKDRRKYYKPKQTK